MLSLPSTGCVHWDWFSGVFWFVCFCFFNSVDYKHQTRKTELIFGRCASLLQNPGVSQNDGCIIQLRKKYTSFWLNFSPLIPKYTHFLYFLFLKPKTDGEFLLNTSGFSWIPRNIWDLQAFLVPLNCSWLVWPLEGSRVRGRRRKTQAPPPLCHPWGSSEGLCLLRGSGGAG